MRRMVVLLFALQAALLAQTPTWKRYTPGNTGTQGNYARSILLDTNNTFWVASNDPVWDEGGLAYFDGRRFYNWSNVDSTCPSFELNSLRRDAQGIIWAGSPVGLLKFDGSNWTVYNRSVAPFPSDTVRGVDIDSAGNVWFAMNDFINNQGGLGRFDGSTFQFWTRQTGIPWPEPWNGVECVACAPGGLVYIGSDVVGAARFDGANWNWYDPWGSNPPPSNQIGDIEVQPDGVVWMSDPTSTGLGIGRLDGDTWTYENPPGTRGVSSLEWRNDSLLVGTYGTGVWSLYAGNWTRYDWIGSHAYDVHFGTGGTVWACGIGGVGHYAGGNWQGWSIANTGLTERWSEAIDFDRLGNAWISTNGGGMCRFDGETWLDFNPYNGGNPPWPFPTDQSKAAIDDDSGRVWVAPSPTGVGVWDGASWVRRHSGVSLGDLIRDSTGRIWATGGLGLSLFTPDSYVSYDYLNSPLPYYVTGACADTGGFLWATTAWGGLYHTDGVAFDSFTPRNSGMPGEGGCWSPVRGPDGRIWMGLGLGFAIFNPRDTSWVAYDTANSPIPFTANDYFAVTSEGVLWFASQSDDDGALVRFDGSNWVLYTTQNSPLPHWQIWAVAVDRNDNAWVSSVSEGVVVVMDHPVAAEERHVPQVSRFKLHAVPNPFRDRVTVRFGANLTGSARLTIVDAAGRRIRALSVPRGASSSTWDGRDDAGRALSAGVYFARFSTASGTMHAKLLLQR